MSELPADALPERTLLEATSHYLEGFNRLLGLVRRELRIFDPDLSGLDMNSTRRIEMLTRFLRQDRTHAVYVALHDIEHVTQRCPRLITLMGSYTTGIRILRTQGDAAKVQDCFVLADRDHLVRRPDAPAHRCCRDRQFRHRLESRSRAWRVLPGDRHRHLPAPRA